MREQKNSTDHQIITQVLYERVQLVVRNQVATVTLKRADKLNALDLQMLKGLTKAARIIKQDKTIRAVLLCGEGTSFCAGLDFASVLKKPLQILPRLFKYGTQTNHFQDVAWCWRQLPVPVIAVIQGHCFGGGFQIALGADFRFTTEDCQFSVMEAKWGLIPDMSATVTLRELISIDVAKELTMTGRIFTGLEAKNYGLVTHVSDNPFLEAQNLIDEIKTRSPDSVALTKKLFHSTWNKGTRWAFALETWFQLKLFLGKNQKIAMKSNFKKESPQFLPRR